MLLCVLMCAGSTRHGRYTVLHVLTTGTSPLCCNLTGPPWSARSVVGRNIMGGTDLRRDAHCSLACGSRGYRSSVDTHMEGNGMRCWACHGGGGVAV